jgi:hypothetical protein
VVLLFHIKEDVIWNWLFRAHRTFVSWPVTNEKVQILNWSLIPSLFWSFLLYRIKPRFEFPQCYNIIQRTKGMLHSVNSDSTLNLLCRWIYEAVKKALVCAVACRLRNPVSLNILDCAKCQINGFSGYLFSFLYFQEGCYSQRISSEEIQKDNINMEGYSKIDPTPKSTATIVSRPIEHGTLLIPYIPGPTLLDHPKQGRFKSPPSLA